MLGPVLIPLSAGKQLTPPLSALWSEKQLLRLSSLGTFTAGERVRENKIGPILAQVFAYATPVPTYSPLNAACHCTTALHGHTKPSDRPPCLHKEDLCTRESVSDAARVGCRT